MRVLHGPHRLGEVEVSLNLAWDSEDGVLHFGNVHMVLKDEDDPEYRRDVTRAIFYQLVQLENELADLRRWKRQIDEWVQQRPPG